MSFVHDFILFKRYNHERTNVGVIRRDRTRHILLGRCISDSDELPRRYYFCPCMSKIFQREWFSWLQNQYTSLKDLTFYTSPSPAIVRASVDSVPVIPLLLKRSLIWSLNSLLLMLDRVEEDTSMDLGALAFCWL